MIVNDQKTVENILSEEGSTQGDVTAMQMYAIGIRPLIDILHAKTDSSLCCQVWYADDSSSAGKLREIRRWWDVLNEWGPKYGYFPKASKTILIVKNPDDEQMAKELFEGTNIKITLSGERHLGAVIGREEFRDEYIRNKIIKWVDDIEELSSIAENEPQLAYSAYTKALSMRWCFLQRTIPNIKHYFEPLEEVIREKFIPAVIGRRITDVERKTFGGLGIQNPVETADTEFSNSYLITRNLTTLIQNQEQDLQNYDEEQLKAVIKSRERRKTQRKA